MPTTTRTLSLRFDIPEQDQPNRPVVTILIDGEDLLGDLGDRRLIGFDPADVLDTGALRPTEDGRRIALVRCECGEAGCRCVAPVVTRIDDRVRWTDFRNFVGVFVRPLVEHPPTGGESYELDDIEFDAHQYLDEVDRATADRSWETPERRTARLLTDLLRPHDSEFGAAGYWIGSVGPHWERTGAYNVSFIAPHGQIIVELIPDDGLPENQAIQMRDHLLITPPDVWNVSVRNDWPADAVAAQIAYRNRFDE